MVFIMFKYDVYQNLHEIDSQYDKQAMWHVDIPVVFQDKLILWMYVYWVYLLLSGSQKLIFYYLPKFFSS